MKKYLVGGAVRDTLMGRPPADKDYVVVGTTPEEMLALGFQRVGADFPVYLHPETGEEYALARIERKTRAGYHGFAVEFGKEVTLEQDLSRRDLTINSMAMDEDGNVIDPYGGVSDLHKKVLRHTSEAFSEDPLRVIRLARFYARYTEFKIAPPTVKLAKNLVSSGELDSLSQERFWGEMEKVFNQSGDPSRFFDALNTFGVLEKVAFFKDLFGSANWKFADVVISNIKALAEPDTHLRIFVGLMASDDAKQESAVIPSEVKRLVNNMRSLSKMENTPEGILRFMKGCRAFSQGSGFSDVLKALLIHETSFTLPSVFLILKLAHLVASKVTSDEFVHLKGGEIGKAMDEERVKQIEAALNKFRGVKNES